MKVWKIALVSVLALGLVLGVASQALAAPPWASPPWASPPLEVPPPPRIIRGEVVSIADASFVVRSAWSEVTVLVNDETEYLKASAPPGALSLSLRPGEPAEPGPQGFGFMQRLRHLVGGALASVPALVRNRLELRERVREELGVTGGLCPFAEEASFEDIEVGSVVAVWAVPDGDDPLARRVVISKPIEYHHVVGTINGLDSETITIMTDGGESIVLSYDEETHFILRGSFSLEVGDSVRAVYDGEDMVKLVIVVTASG
jgi:hypothetical protein